MLAFSIVGRRETTLSMSSCDRLVLQVKQDLLVGSLLKMPHFLLGHLQVPGPSAGTTALSVAPAAFATAADGFKRAHTAGVDEPAFAALVGLLIYGKQVRCGTNGRAGVCRIRTAAPAPAGVYARTRLLTDKGGSECCEWRRDATWRGLAWCGADWV